MSQRRDPRPSGRPAPRRLSRQRWDEQPLIRRKYTSKEILRRVLSCVIAIPVLILLDAVMQYYARVFGLATDIVGGPGFQPQTPLVV